MVAGQRFSQSSKKGQEVPQSLFWENVTINCAPKKSHVRISSMEWSISDILSIITIRFLQLLEKKGHGWNPVPSQLGGEYPQNASLEKLNTTNSTTWALCFQNKKHKMWGRVKKKARDKYSQKVYTQGRWGPKEKHQIKPLHDTLATRFHTPTSPGICLQYLGLFCCLYLGAGLGAGRADREIQQR